MKRTSPSCRSVSMAARSPARTSTGPGRDPQADAHLGGHDAGQRRLAQPGGPANSRWSAGWSRLRAASMTMPRCSVSWAWPTNSSRVRGRRPASSASSAGSATGSTARAGSRSTRVGVRHRAGAGQHLLAGLGAHRLRTSSRRAARTSSSTGASPSTASSARRSPRGRSPARPGRPGPRPGPSRRPAGRRPAAVQDGRSRRAFSSRSRRAAVFLPTPGHQAQRVEVVLQHGRRQGRRRQRRQDGQGQRRDRPRGPRAGPRSTGARRRGRSRRGRWRPRGRGCARGGRPRYPAGPSPASVDVGTDAR